MSSVWWHLYSHGSNRYSHKPPRLHFSRRCSNCQEAREPSSSAAASPGPARGRSRRSDAAEEQLRGAKEVLGNLTGATAAPLERPRPEDHHGETGTWAEDNPRRGTWMTTLYMLTFSIFRISWCFLASAPGACSKGLNVTEYRFPVFIFFFPFFRDYKSDALYREERVCSITPYCLSALTSDISCLQ